MVISKQRLVVGTQLRRAREILLLSPKEVSEHLGVQPDEILDWEDGRLEPNLENLEILAEFYGREMDYFLRDDIPSPPTGLKYRSATKQPFASLSVEARRVVAKFDELCRTAYELECTLGKVLPVQIPHISRDKSPVDLAREERRKYGFGQKPISKLRDHLMQNGVRVFELVIPREQFSGFSYWHKDYGPCILVNAREVPGRKAFTLAHEYAHLLYHHEPSVCAIPAEEMRSCKTGEESLANAFAIEFLMPEKLIREDFGDRAFSMTPSIREVGKMAGKWGVSVQAMLYRLEKLGLIKRGHANNLLASYTPQPYYPRHPAVPTWRKRLGNVYVSNAIEAYKKGYISLGKLAHCLGRPLRKALEVAGQ